jgi:hypothetical protein
MKKVYYWKTKEDWIKKGTSIVEGRTLSTKEQFKKRLKKNVKLLEFKELMIQNEI